MGDHLHGVILAGGTGSRLRPVTLAVNKHLLPLYDRPVVYAPLATLLQAGITRLTVVTGPEDPAAWQRLLGDGSQFGLDQLDVRIQERPEGVLDALAAALPGASPGPWLVALGDCVVLDRRLGGWLRLALADCPPGACAVAASEVPDGRAFGVVRFDQDGAVTALDEKPVAAGPAWALPGVAVFGADLPERLRSARSAGAADLPDLYRRYHDGLQLTVERFDPPLQWFDAGTPADLAAAGAAIQADPALASPELAAQRAGRLDAAGLAAAAERSAGGPYADRLRAWAGADHG